MIGTRLGPYEITAKLGEGGMGEVYRATDSKLKREVAIKVLPAGFTQDEERLGRFEREAQLLAQLHHPHIASIFGLEESEGISGLVMELVEGPTLAEKLQAGPLPLDEALGIARQIAEALEEAHEKGIIHRDLKPQNVKLTPDGRVKVLDFGLAKAMDPRGVGSASPLASPTMMNSPTLTALPGTQLGVILGTAAYMAPEQARGQVVDKRADIWAFGVVLYEMLTGAKLFASETVSDTLAGVLKTEVDLEKLPGRTPARLRRLVQRCLDRQARSRLRDIGEARIALEAISSGEESTVAPATSGSGRSFPLGLVAGAVAGVLLTSAWWVWRTAGSDASDPAARSRTVTEFSVQVEDLAGFSLSPDGSRLAWATRGRLGEPTLWVRDLDDLEPRAVVTNPNLGAGFWSPDGLELAVQIEDQLWRVDVTTGERRLVCDLPTVENFDGKTILAGLWREDGSLLFASWRGGIYTVPVRGGEPRVFLPIDPEVDVDFHQIVPLSDGDSLLLEVHRQRTDDAPANRLEVVRGGERRVVAGWGDRPEIRPVGLSNGVLAWIDREGDDPALKGLPFDAERGAVSGDSFVLVPRVSSAALAADGTMVYLPSRSSSSVTTRVDRSGSEIATVGRPHEGLSRAALSPDGSRLAVVLDLRELWVHDLRRDTLTRLASEDFLEDPQWSADGRTIYYAAAGKALFRRVRAEPGATPETVLENAFRGFLAPDGSGILVRGDGGFRLNVERGLFWVPLDADGRPGERTTVLALDDAAGRLAPRGRMLGYSLLTEGRRDVLLSTFPAVDQTLQLSSRGGGTPQWSVDGRALYYLSGGELVEVEVGLTETGRLTASPERRLFELSAAGLDAGGWTVAPDGEGFLFIRSLEGDEKSELVVARHGLDKFELGADGDRP